MTKFTLIIGALLIALGVVTYAIGADGKHSPTALIPAGEGALLLIAGLIAVKPAARMHAMHIAVIVGLIGFIAAIVALIYGRIDLAVYLHFVPNAIARLIWSVYQRAWWGLSDVAFYLLVRPQAKAARVLAAMGPHVEGDQAIFQGESS